MLQRKTVENFTIVLKKRKPLKGGSAGASVDSGQNKGRKRSRVEYQGLATEGMVGCSVARVACEWKEGGRAGLAKIWTFRFGRFFSRRSFPCTSETIIIWETGNKWLKVQRYNMQSFSHTLNLTISSSTIKSTHKNVLGTSNWPGVPSAARDQNDMI